MVPGIQVTAGVTFCTLMPVCEPVVEPLVAVMDCVPAVFSATEKVCTPLSPLAPLVKKYVEGNVAAESELVMVTEPVKFVARLLPSAS